MVGEARTDQETTTAQRLAPQAGLVIGAGAFFAVASPFGAVTYLPELARFGYWVALLLIAFVAARCIDWALDRVRVAPSRMSLALLRSLIAAPPVWFTILGVQTFIARPVPGHFLPELLGCVWTVCIALFAVAALVERRAPASIAIAPPLRDATPAPSPPEPPSGLQAHLPLKLRGAEIQALSAEDHYVRVHTDRGEHLILMRLSDAIATLPPDAGVRIHRSWWVAVREVQHVERENRGARVALKTGAVARASRAGLSELRRLGFL